MRLHSLSGPNVRRDDVDGEPVLAGETGEAASTDGAQLWTGRSRSPFTLTSPSWPSLMKPSPRGAPSTRPGGTRTRRAIVCRHEGGVDRARGALGDTRFCGRGPHRRMVRHQLATDAGGRAKSTALATP